MPIENVTANRSYQLPNGANDLVDDVDRLIAAIGSIDVDVAAVLVSLAAKAGLISPTFTGTPQAPTAVLGTDSAQIATTAFVQAATAALVASAPGTLDTLNELAAALGDDPNFATTIATALSNRLRFDASQTLTNTQKLQGIDNLGLFDRFVRHDSAGVLGAPAIAQLLTNMGVSADVQEVLAAADAASARASLGLAWERIPVTIGASNAVATGLSAFEFLRMTIRGTPANDGVNALIRVSSNDGSSYDSGGTDYGYSVRNGASAVALSQSAGSTDGIYFAWGQVIGNAAAEGIHAYLEIDNFNNAAYSFFSGRSFYINGSGVYQDVVSIQGARVTATAHDAIEFRWSAGNIGTLTFLLEGMRG